MIEGKGAAPFLKWAGGKRSIIDDLKAHLPKEFNDYYEPFLGGGALFFELSPRTRRAVLSDSNLDLMLTYTVVKKHPEALIEHLEEHAKKHDEKYYYVVRSQHGLQESVKIAARFIYLNRTAYNGLYRVNKSGQFNVPVGSYTDPNIVQRERIYACSDALSVAELQCREFDTINPQAGDLVYCDPPYYPLDSISFTGYTKLDFNQEDHIRLRDLALRLHEKGVKVMLSNSDTPFTRELYSSKVFNVVTVQAPRNINSVGTKRGAISELLITTYAP